MVAVFTIGIIGFLLDRVMIALQTAVQLRQRRPVTERTWPFSNSTASARATAAARSRTEVLHDINLSHRAKANSSPSSASPARGKTTLIS